MYYVVVAVAKGEGGEDVVLGGMGIVTGRRPLEVHGTACIVFHEIREGRFWTSGWIRFGDVNLVG